MDTKNGKGTRTLAVLESDMLTKRRCVSDSPNEQPAQAKESKRVAERFNDSSRPMSPPGRIAQLEEQLKQGNQGSDVDLMKIVAARSVRNPLVEGSDYLEEGKGNACDHNSNNALLPGAYAGAPGRGLQPTPLLRYSSLGMPASGNLLCENDYDSPEYPERYHDEDLEGQEQRRADLIKRSGLVVACLVDEPGGPCELPEAKELDISATEQKRREDNNKVMGYLAFGSLWLFLIVLTVVLVLVTSTVGTATSETTKTPEGSQPLGSTTTGVPPVDELETLFESLPEATKEVLLNTNAPQRKAWEWLLDHPNVVSIPEWKKQQLFAMATFYYSFEGPKWPEKYGKNWLSYEMDECSWINTSLEYLYWTSEAYQRRTDFDLHPCNEAGEIQTLALRYLGLADENPTIPAEISLLSSLAAIVLVFNQITAPLSDMLNPALSQMTNLKVFILHANNIFGTIPPEIARMTTLEYLVIGNNAITGSIPTEIAQLSELKQLSLPNIPLLGSLPTQLGLLSRLTDLEIFGNALTGQIPSELGLISGMEDFHLSYNSLSGSIPSELGLFTNMVDFDIEANNLIGAVPTEFGLFTSMRSFDIEDNHLHGAIPSELGLMAPLQTMQIGGNNLSGSVPSELGLLSQMVRLRIDRNAISGSLPAQIWELSKLGEILLLNLTKLTGTIHDSACKLQMDTCIYDVRVWPLQDSSEECLLDFDCTESLCGCDCPCPHSSDNSTAWGGNQGQ